MSSPSLFAKKMARRVQPHELAKVSGGYVMDPTYRPTTCNNRIYPSTDGYFEDDGFFMV